MLCGHNGSTSCSLQQKQVDTTKNRNNEKKDIIFLSAKPDFFSIWIPRSFSRSQLKKAERESQSQMSASGQLQLH